ncbi:MAG: hypothetical protein U0790_17715 [Isosphaeraceae bacterium]
MSKRQLPRFYTGLLVPDYEDFASPPYRGKNWFVDLIPGDRSLGNQPNQGGVDRYGNSYWRRNPEVVISAPSQVIAQRAIELTLAADAVFNGSAYGGYGPAAWSGGPYIITEARLKEHLQKADVEPGYHRPFSQYMNMPWACMIAAKASYRMRHMYAIQKWELSASTFSTHVGELDPMRRRTIPKSQALSDHVKYATAIILAYSVVEELGFEIRASNQQPSAIHGKWNPPVLEELERRLKAGKINLDETFVWNLRGSKTVLERDKPKHMKIAYVKSPWSRYDVRDREIHVVDALAWASWLRSRVSSHKLKAEYVSRLSVYDVANVQDLARRLILETLGFWRNHPNMVPPD